jgi:hypothetical protein
MKKYIVVVCVFLSISIFVVFYNKDANLTSDISTIRTNKIINSINSNDNINILDNNPKIVKNTVFDINSILDEEDQKKKLELIENNFDNPLIKGYSYDIANALGKEENIYLAKSLSKLLMNSFDNSTDVVGIVSSAIISKNGKYIIDYTLEYLSSDEILQVYYSTKDSITTEEANSLISFHETSSIINGEKPILSINGFEKNQDILVTTILLGSDDKNYIKLQQSNEYTRSILSEKPKNINNVLDWTKANILLCKDEYEKGLFKSKLNYLLSDDEKKLLSENNISIVQK